MNNLHINEKNFNNLNLDNAKLSEERHTKYTGYATIDKPWLSKIEESKLNWQLPEMSAYQYMLYSNFDNMHGRAINYFGHNYTYLDIVTEIEKTAQAFLAMGVKKGDIVTISSVLTPELNFAFYALNRIGAIPNMIDPRTKASGMKQYLQEVNSKYLITLDKCYPVFESILEDTIVETIIAIDPYNSIPTYLKAMKSVKEKLDKKRLSSLKSDFSYKNHEYYISQEDCDKLEKEIKRIETQIAEEKYLKETWNKIKNNPNCYSWNEFMDLSKKSKEEISDYYEPNSTACIVHTGGTSGFPKGVMISNENLNSMIMQINVANLQFERGQKFLNILVPWVAYGVANGIHLSMCKGWESVLVPSFTPEDFPNLILKHKPNNILGIPSYWESVLKNEKMQTADLSFLINCIVGGDGMKIENEQKLNEFFKSHGANISLIKGYGMTEVNACSTVSTLTDNELGSVGIPLFKLDISVFDPNNLELKYGELGEICIKGPTTMLGYYNNQEATNDIIKTHPNGEKWLHTGDIGYMTNDSHLFIMDRIKKMIIRSGFKVFPSEIEKVIMMHKAVLDCCVVGIPDVVDVTAPKAHIVLKEEYKGQEETILEEIKSLCNEHLIDYNIPVGYKIRENLPKTPIGKIDFMALINEEKEKVKKIGEK